MGTSTAQVRQQVVVSSLAAAPGRRAPWLPPSACRLEVALLVGHSRMALWGTQVVLLLTSYRATKTLKIKADVFKIFFR